MSIHKKITSFSNLNDKINSLNVLQNFMDTMGEYLSVDEKLKRINSIILQKYETLKYSTIVVFDGAEYKVKASNVNQKHWETLTNLYNEEIFIGFCIRLSCGGYVCLRLRYGRKRRTRRH